MGDGPGASARAQGSGDEAATAAPDPPTAGGGCHSAPEAKVLVRQLPRLVRQGVDMVWAAGRRDFLVVLALQVLSGVDIAVLLVLGRRGLSELLAALDGGDSLATVSPWALVLATLVAINLILNAVLRERQQLLGELVVRYVQDSVLDVATEVELDVFDTPSFHNRSQRIQQDSHRPLDLVWGLTGLVQGAIGVVGVVVAFLAVAPLVVPLMALVVLPVWLGASRRSQLF